MHKYLYFVLIGLSLIWGGSFFFIKVLLDYAEPAMIAFWRSVFGIFAIILLSMLMKRKWLWAKKHTLMMILIGVMNTALPWSLIAFSEQRLTSNLASVMNATTPLWTLLIGAIIFRNKQGWRQWAGMGIGFIGLLILLEINPVHVAAVNLTGFLGMLTATFCYGLSSHLVKRYLKELSNYQLAAGTLIACMLSSGIVSFLAGDFTLEPLLNTKSLLALVGLGIFGSGLANILFYILIQEGSAEFASFTTYLIPVTAIIWGSVLLNEEVRWSLLAGLMFILSGVFLASRKPSVRTELRQSA